jgi:hypothetical protein
MSETPITDTQLARESRRNGVVLMLAGLVFAVLCYHWARIVGVPAPIPPAAQAVAAQMMEPPPPLPIAPGAPPPTVMVRYAASYVRSHPDAKIVLQTPSLDGLDEKRAALLRERLVSEVGLAPETFITEAVGSGDARMLPATARDWVAVQVRTPQR